MPSVAVALVLALSAVDRAVAALAERRIDVCVQRAVDGDFAESATVCFDVLYDELDRADLLAPRVRELAQRYADPPWLLMRLGRIGFPREAGAYERAAVSFRELGQPREEVQALRYAILSSHIAVRPRRETTPLVRRLETLVGREDPVVDVGARAGLASHRLGYEYDVGGAAALLEGALDVIERAEIVREGGFEDEPLALEVFDRLIRVSERIGRPRQRIEFARRRLEYAERRPEDRDRLVRLRFEYLLAQAAHGVSLDLAQVERDLARLVEDLESSWIPDIGPSAYRLLARLQAEGESVPSHLYARCVEDARRSSSSNEELLCHLAAGNALASLDEGRARRSLDAALALEAGDSVSIGWLLEGWRDWLGVVWSLHSPDQAAARSGDLLASLEHLESRHAGDARARFAATHSGPFYWIAGLLLRSSSGEERIGRALEVMERHRASGLRRQMAAGDGGFDSELETIRDGLTQVYRKLLDPALAAAGREALLAERRELERRAALRQGRLPAVPRLASRTGLLAQLQRALDPSRALLLYQLGDPETRLSGGSGGAWLTVVLHDRALAFELEAAGPEIGQLVGMALDLEEGAPRLVERLSEILVEDALDALPKSVTRLVIVPDGSLHELPFAALRQPDGRPLIERFDLHRVQSASIFLDLLERRPTVDGEGALILANPTLGRGLQGASDATPLRRTTIELATELAPLPHAEREGRRLLRRLGEGSDLFVGEEASEVRLKGMELGAYSVLHFATHALVDRYSPHRSAVVLAAGDESQDGLLRTPEIGGLDRLDGKTIILSTCDSATGDVLRGEGVLGLSRAFFEAGAQAVVGSLWPLEDERAAEFFTDLYERLSHGLPLGAALSQTRREWQRAGLDRRVWSGIVLVGDAEVVPFASAPGADRNARWVVGLGVLGIAFLAVAARRIRRAH